MTDDEEFPEEDKIGAVVITVIGLALLVAVVLMAWFGEDEYGPGGEPLPTPGQTSETSDR